jgi:hypothetical protein
LDNVRPISSSYGFVSRFTIHIASIDDIDYLVLYAGKNQTGETALVLANKPNVNLHNSNTVHSAYDNTTGLLYLNYALSGSSFVSVGSNLMVVVLEKPVALTWHAPVIAGDGVHGKFYGIGSNETCVHDDGFLWILIDMGR